MTAALAAWLLLDLLFIAVLALRAWREGHHD